MDSECSTSILSQNLNFIFQLSKKFNNLALVWKIILVLSLILFASFYFYLIWRLLKMIYYQRIEQKFQDFILCSAVLIFFVTFKVLILQQCQYLIQVESHSILEGFLYFVFTSTVIFIIIYLILKFHDLFFKFLLIINLTIISLICTDSFKQHYQYNQTLIFILIFCSLASILILIYKFTLESYLEKISLINLLFSTNFFKCIFVFSCTSLIGSAFLYPAVKTLINYDWKMNNNYVLVILIFYILWFPSFIMSVNDFFCLILFYNTSKEEQYRNKSFFTLLAFSLKPILYRSLVPVYFLYFILLLIDKIIDYFIFLRKRNINSPFYSLICFLENCVKLICDILGYPFRKIRDQNLVLAFDSELQTYEDVYLKSKFSIAEFSKFFLSKFLLFFPLAFYLVKKVPTGNQGFSNWLFDVYNFSFNFSNCFYFLLIASFLSGIDTLFPTKKSNRLNIIKSMVIDPSDKFHLRGRIYFTF